MNLNSLKIIHKEIIHLVLQNRIHDVFGKLEEIRLKMPDASINDGFVTLSETYQNMLKYSFQYGPDPKRSNIYRKLQQSVMEITDQLIEEYALEQGWMSLGRKMLEGNRFAMNPVSEIAQLLHIFTWTDLNEDNTEIPSDIVNEQRLLANELFYYLMLTSSFKEKEKLIFTRMIEHSEVPWRVKCLMISALTMSLLRHFDREKFYLLFNQLQNDKDEIRQRTIFGLLINTMFYHERLQVYDDITSRLQTIPDDKKLQERFFAQYLQYLRACETENITRKIQEEIVPEVLKIRNDLEEKLKLNDLLKRENFEDKNPEWENFFKDAPDVYQKLEQFSKMQNEGSDVFMGAFAMLKHFTFFNELTNWFQPFYGKSLALRESLNFIRTESDVDALIDGLEKSSVLCNSDKYSFCLNIQYLPVQQRNMMLELFNMEIKSMNENMDDEFSLNTESRNKVVNTQYIQDLYRFFKLHPRRSEFPDIFGLSPDITESPVMKILFNDDVLLRNLAEFYFAKDVYADALPLYKLLNSRNSSFELLEKIGFCFQKLNRFKEAIQAYHEAELYDRNTAWLARKLSFCYKREGNFEKAIQYYQDILKEEPNKLENLVYLGQLYIDSENYTEALKYYYQVEFEGNQDKKIYRPIGWCNFVLGNYKQALKYFEKLKSDTPSRSDLLNLGHACWVTGNTAGALDNYRLALEKSGTDITWFRRAFESDSKYLEKAGIDKLDISLMTDYVIFM